MGDDDGGHAVLDQVLDDLQNLADHLGVEGGGGLVKEHDVRLHRQRPDDGKALFLAAGELAGVLVDLIQQADPGQQRLCLLKGLGFGLFAQHGGGQHDVLADGHMGEDVEMLENHPHLLPVEVDVDLFVGDVHPFKVDMAAGGHLQKV